MIALLLRRDALLAAQLPVFAIVAALMGLLGGLFMGVARGFAELSAQSSGQSLGGFDLDFLMTGMLGLQCVFVGFVISASWASRWDGVQPTARSQPMELMLPIAPRSAWCARLIANFIVVAVSLFTPLLVFTLLGLPDATLALWKVAAASATVVLFCFGLFPDQAAPRGRLVVVSTILMVLISALLLGFDLGVFQDDAPRGTRFGVEVALALAAVWALRAYRRLPLSWGLPIVRSRRQTHGGRPALGESPASASWSRSSERSAAQRVIAQWSMICATVSPFRVFALSVSVSAFVWICSYRADLVKAWVPVCAIAGFVGLSARLVLLDARFLSALPISRRRILGVILGPLVCGSALAAVLGLSLASDHDGMRPLVTMDDQLEQHSEVDPDRLYFNINSWVDVIVPLHLWRMAGVDGVPSQVAPDGERVTPRAVHPLGLGFLTVYNPYDAPLGSSQSFTAWQFSRALHAEYGVSLDPEALSERYLQTDRNGQVDFSNEQVRRNLAEREAEGRPWYGTLGTLAYDYPETVSHWNPRRAALPVLAAVLLATLLGALALRMREGTWTLKVMLFLYAILCGISFSLDSMLGHWLGQGHPQVLFAIAGETFLSWLPDGPLFVWSLTVAAAVMGFFILGKALDRAEVMARKVPRVHTAD